MFIRTQNEILSVMPTARWSRPEQLLGYLEEEERVALEPLLGTTLYQHLCNESERLRELYVDITPTTIKPTGKAKEDPALPYADVTENLDRIQAGYVGPLCDVIPSDEVDVPEVDRKTVDLLRICQQIEFYKMLAHKSGLLTVSFNEGGGMNMVSAEGYDPADEKRMERVVKDAWMSAGRSVDTLLLFLEADAKGDRTFTDMWKEADAFYLRKDLLFQTARVLNEYLDIKGERMAYVGLVRDIRFCQNTYLKPRIGAKLLKAVVAFANGEEIETSPATEETVETAETEGTQETEESATPDSDTMEELLSMLRTALGFFVEGRRAEMETMTGVNKKNQTLYGPAMGRMARRDSMTDAMQAMAAACDYIGEHLEELGDVAVDSPIYNAIRAREEQEAKDVADIDAAHQRHCREVMEQARKKLFTSFPATHRTPERK